jgi:hypothetical protein
VTHTYTGPAAIFLTTIAIDVDEELLNRCLVLTVDEDREQTRAIHDRQRHAQALDGHGGGPDQETAPGRAAAPGTAGGGQPSRRAADVRRRGGPLPAGSREVPGVIAAVTLLHQHQHQRPVKTVTRGGRVLRYVETGPAGIALASSLFREALGRSLDELPPGTRRLLDALHGYVTTRCQAEGLDADLVRFHPPAAPRGAAVRRCPAEGAPGPAGRL